jgi:hypothetical protein
MKPFEKLVARPAIDRIRRIELRWRKTLTQIQCRLQGLLPAGPITSSAGGMQNVLISLPAIDLSGVQAKLVRLDRLMQLALVAYGRDIGRIRSMEGGALLGRRDIALIAEQLAHLDQKAATLRDSVLGLMEKNAELELQLKQEHVQALRLDQARQAALAWSDILRAELDRKSEALCRVQAELANVTARQPSPSAKPQPS